MPVLSVGGETMKIYPTKFEAYDEALNSMFRVESFDECSATVTIETVVNVASWDEISAGIRDCLVQMQLEEGE